MLWLPLVLSLLFLCFMILLSTLSACAFYLSGSTLCFSDVLSGACGNIERLSTCWGERLPEAATSGKAELSVARLSVRRPRHFTLLPFDLRPPVLDHLWDTASRSDNFLQIVGLCCSWWPSVVDGRGDRQDSTSFPLCSFREPWAPGVHGKEALQNSGRGLSSHRPFSISMTSWIHTDFGGPQLPLLYNGKVKAAPGLRHRLSCSLGADARAKTANSSSNEVKHSASKWTSVSVDSDWSSW